MQARWAYFFGPGCEPGLRELDRVMRRGGTAFVVDNDTSRSTFGSWFRRGYPMIDADEVERFWSRARLAAPQPGRRLAVRDPRGAGGVRAASSSPSGRRRGGARRPPGHRGRLRRRPVVAHVLSSAGVADAQRRREHADRAPGSAGARAARRGSAPPRPPPPRAAAAPRSAQGVQTCAAIESSKPTTARSGPARRPALVEGPQRAHRDGVAGAQRTRSAGRPRTGRAARARPASPNSRVSSPRADSRLVGRPWSCIRSTQPAAAVLADERALLPADPGDPGVAALDEVVDRELDTGAAVDVHPGVPRRGLLPGPAEGHERHAVLGQPGRVRVAAEGVGDARRRRPPRTAAARRSGSVASWSPSAVNSSTW